MENYRREEEVKEMQLHLKNIGPIDSIDINVDSDLSFIYGKNNIGKSYAITILYLVLKNFSFNLPMPSRYFFGRPSRIRSNDDYFSDIKTKIESNVEFDITDNIIRYFSDFLSAMFLPYFENSLHNSFGDISNLNNKMSNGQFYLGVEFDDYAIHITEKNNKLIARYDGKGKKYLCRKVQRHRYPKTEHDHVILYYTEEDQFLEDIQTHFYNLYKTSVFSILSKISSVYYLPASRSGLYRALNAFSQILAELAKKRNFLSEKIVLPSISEQDSDYFSKINEINIRRVNQKFSSVAENIEKKLLKGKVSIDQSTKQILFHPNKTDINLELLGTSSMIAEVSPIVLYLRYIIGSEENFARGKDGSGRPIIFIEEPEAHLHPEAQIILMECFADLVKIGAKLVITSHSNYMFQKLNNLIAEKKIDKAIINGIIFSQGEKGSYSKTIPMSDIGMEDNNFVEVAEDLYNEKIKIIEKMETDDAEQNQI
jgi:predicted ATPase